jgi:hypothetical protein
MRQIRETLRLHQAGPSYSEVGRALKIFKSVVGKYVTLVRVAGVDCALSQTLDDEELGARVYRPALPRGSDQLAPDLGVVHQERKRPGVTLLLLWEEYATSTSTSSSRATATVCRTGSCRRRPMAPPSACCSFPMGPGGARWSLAAGTPSTGISRVGVSTAQGRAR